MRAGYKFMGRYPELASKLNTSPSSVCSHGSVIPYLSSVDEIVTGACYVFALIVSTDLFFYFVLSLLLLLCLFLNAFLLSYLVCHFVSPYPLSHSSLIPIYAYKSQPTHCINASLTAHNEMK